MKKYPNYKDSGVEWLGEIPEHWEVAKTKYFASILNGYAFDSKTYCDEGLPIIRIGDIGKKPNYSFLKKVPFKLFEKVKRFKILNGDILLALTGATIGKSSVFYDDLDCFLNQRVGVIRASALIKQSYLSFLVSSDIFKENISLLCFGGAQENIGKPEIENIILNLPPLPEQEAIANYLDEKTAKIDLLVELKEKQIELLKEQRTALINQAVTKGLNPNAKMKDSGIEWLGEIPEHWEVKRVKHNTFVKGRIGWHGLTTAEYLEEGYSFLITGTNFKDGFINWDSCDFVSQERFEQDSYIQVKEGDVLITKDGTIGKVAIVKGLNGVATLNSGIFLTRPIQNAYNSNFFYWLLNSNVFITFIDLIKSGTTISHLYQNTFVEFSFPLPPKNEQQEIISYLDEKTVKIKDSISKAKSQIEFLKEYRTALISEAVTGKIDVSDKV